MAESICLPSPVQSKIHCIFESKVVQIPSKKRHGQNYKVVASDIVSKHAAKFDNLEKRLTEKIDGTCCFMHTHEGEPCLYARFDRKPTKPVEKKLKQFFAQHNRWERDGKEGEEPTFELNVKTDLKSVPSAWIPAKRVLLNEENLPLPDKNGHTPGWVPISTDTKQYCWHHTVVEQGRLLIVRNSSESIKGTLEIVDLPFAEVIGNTFELVGTCINANPYGLGSKDCPFHFLIQHGCITVELPIANFDYDSLHKWFSSDDCKMEGLVWHCSDGSMFKLHRHHMDLKWPLEVKSDASLSQRPVKVMMSKTDIALPTKLFEDLRQLNGQLFDSLYELAKSL